MCQERAIYKLFQLSFCQRPGHIGLYGRGVLVNVDASHVAFGIIVSAAYRSVFGTNWKTSEINGM